ncbi:hypothetical protein BH23GEM10_BH23GEM10_08200 [soil metagenome]
MRWRTRYCATCTLITLGLLGADARTSAGQTLLERTPNVAGPWVGAPHSLHFNFLHRFNHSGAPIRQVTNRPTFLLAYGTPFDALIGAQYATRSDVAERMPNEWELFGRYRLLEQDLGMPLDVAAQVAYNVAAQSVDGELSAARRFGAVRVLGAGRALSAGYGGDTRFALAGGATLRIGRWLAVAADAGKLLDAADHERAAWGVGLQFGIPLTPHSFSVQAGNTNSATRQGASRGADEVRWGFEFTVPVALQRYLGRREPPPVPVAAAPVTDADSARRVAIIDSVTAVLEAEYDRRWQVDSLRFALRDDSLQLAVRLDSIRQAAQQDSIRRAQAEAAQRAAAERARQEAERRRAELPAVRAGMRNLAYQPARIEVPAGTTIIWQNNDQVEHSVTATDRSWDSGVIRPGETWQRTFTEPGTHAFFCTPHPFMTGVIVVRQP